MTFARDAQISNRLHPGISGHGIEKRWMYREFGNVVEFLTDELCLQVNKGTGAIRYMTRDKKLLLSEREKECRQIEDDANGKIKGWLYLNWQKKENLYAPGINGKAGINLRGSARYISYGGESKKLPVIFSEQGYGIVLAADTAVSCDIPAYGSYLYMENKGQLDYYFIAGEERKEIEEACAGLLGKS